MAVEQFLSVKPTLQMQPSVLLQLSEFKHWHVSLQLIPYLPYGHSKMIK